MLLHTPHQVFQIVRRQFVVAVREGNILPRRMPYSFVSGSGYALILPVQYMKTRILLCRLIADLTGQIF
jgi:hypothetical protein